ANALEVDRDLLERVRKACRELEDTPARELINQFRVAPQPHNALRRVAGELACSPDELKSARRYVTGLLNHIEACRHRPAPTPARIARRRGDLSLDGTLRDVDWSRAAVLPLDIPCGHNHTFPGERCDCRLLWDDKFIYAGFDVRVAEII